MRVRDIVEKEVRSGAQYVDLTNWTSRAALEYIGQGGLGYSFNALDEKETRNKYSEAIKTLTYVFLLHLPPKPVINKHRYKDHYFSD